LPKLTNKLRKESYIEKKNGVAQADGRRLLDDKQRRLSNVLRTAELDQLFKAKQKKVSRSLEEAMLPKTMHEENQPNINP